MRNGKCLMCNASEVYTNQESAFRASGNLLSLSDIDNELEIDVIPYVCVPCGFVAMFIDDQEQLREVVEKEGWKRAA